MMLKIADFTFHSRLFTGTGKFASANLMQDAIAASGSQLVTMAMKRIDLRGQDDGILQPLQQLGVKLLPNTSGAKNAQTRNPSGYALFTTGSHRDITRRRAAR